MKQKATWNDIDRCLSNGNLEDQDYDTLLSFSRVSPPPSNNPAFHVKFQNTQNRIIERIRQIDREKKAFPESAADIVIIGSVAGRNVSPFSAVYSASKFAVHALAEGLRREVGPKGVRVSLVEPGIVISGFQDAAGYNDELVNRFHENFGPLLIGEDVANAVCHTPNRRTCISAISSSAPRGRIIRNPMV